MKEKPEGRSVADDDLSYLKFTLPHGTPKWIEDEFKKYERRVHGALIEQFPDDIAGIFKSGVMEVRRGFFSPSAGDDPGGKDGHFLDNNQNYFWNYMPVCEAIEGTQRQILFLEWVITQVRRALRPLPEETFVNRRMHKNGPLTKNDQERLVLLMERFQQEIDIRTKQLDLEKKYGAANGDADSGKTPAPKTMPIEKIIWEHDEEELLDLFKQLANRGYLAKNQAEKISALLDDHFEKPGGKPFKAKQLNQVRHAMKNRTGDRPAPQKAQPIDTMLDNLAKKKPTGK